MYTLDIDGVKFTVLVRIERWNFLCDGNIGLFLSFQLEFPEHHWYPSTKDQ